MNRLKAFLEKLRWPTVILLIAAFTGFSFYNLDQTEIESREGRIETEKSQITVLQRQIAEAKEFERQFAEKKKRYAELVKELQKLQGALPRQFYLPDLLSDIINEAKQLEIEIVSLKPDDRENSEELYNSLGFEIETKGTFLQFFLFMDRIANMKRLVNVWKMEVDKDNERKNVTLGGTEGAFAEHNLSGGRIVYPGLTAKFRLLTYRYRGSLPGDSSATAAPAPASTGRPNGGGGKR
jgi:Tfp pilus assembly protein PilO